MVLEISNKNQSDQSLIQANDHFSRRQKWLLTNLIPELVSLSQRENVDNAIGIGNQLDNVQILEILSKADPNKNHSSVQWIIQTYMKDGFLWEDIQGGQDSKVWDTLNLFYRYRKHLDTDQRSLYQYKTLASVYEAIELWDKAACEKNNLLLTSSARALKRLEKQTALASTQILTDQKDFKIVIPLTVQAAQWWGQGTRWCTAAEKNTMFEYYSKQAPLFVILFQDHENKSRRLQFWCTDLSVQFMDERDAKVSSDFIQKNWKFLKQLIIMLLKSNKNVFPLIPIEYQTQELCWIACKYNGSILVYVPKEFKTKELCTIACQQNGLALQHVPKNILTYNMCLIAVKQSGTALCCVPDRFKDEQLCQIAVQQTGCALFYVPDIQKTEKLCLLALNQTPDAFRYLPPRYQSFDSVEQEIKSNGYNLKYLDTKSRTQNLCELAVQQNGCSLEFVPKKYKTKALCEQAVKQTGHALEFVPERIITQELCVQAVQQSGLSIKYVPESLITMQLCELAIKLNPSSLKYIPNEFRNLNLCTLACKMNGLNLYWVPRLLKTKDISTIAVAQTGLALKNVLAENITQELCMLAVQNNPYSLQFVPLFCINYQQICLQAFEQNNNVVDFIKDNALKDLLKKEILKKRTPVQPVIEINLVNYEWDLKQIVEDFDQMYEDYGSYGLKQNQIEIFKEDVIKNIETLENEKEINPVRKYFELKLQTIKFYLKYKTLSVKLLNTILYSYKR